MTLKELQDDVYSLGYESVKHPSELFINAANRALRIIFSNHKYQKTLRVKVPYPQTTLYMPTVSYKCEPIALPITGRAYSMHVCGKGTLKIRFSTGETVEEFDTDGSVIKGFIPESATLHFSGEYPYTVSDLAVYMHAPGGRVEDIPDGDGKVNFDFSKYPDFMSFAQQPTDAAGYPTDAVCICGCILSVDSHRAKEVYVTYNRMPRKIRADMDADIDIPRAAEAELSLLCASFLWRDSEPELSEHYFNLYRDMTGADERITVQSAKYTTVDGWA